MSKKLGLILAGLGGLLLLVALIYDPTVGDNPYDRTYILGTQTQLRSGNCSDYSCWSVGCLR